VHGEGAAQLRAPVPAGPSALELEGPLPVRVELHGHPLVLGEGCLHAVVLEDEAAQRVQGLDVGADDYLAKPFSFEELLARIRSLVRRHAAVKQTVLEHCGVRVDLLGHLVQVKGKSIDLTSREYALLEIFMQNPGRILTRTLISEKIWASNYEIDTNLLDVYMSRLRNKLEGVAGAPLFKTIRGVGYQLL